MIYIAIIIVIAYLFSMIWFANGIAKYNYSDNILNYPSVSIIVSAHNEEHNIRNLLDALINQNISLASIFDSEYKKAIDQLGSNKNTINLISDYAHFKAFYIHDLESAVSLLESAMKIYNGKEINFARC